MDRNSLLGMLFIGAIIITFSILNKPSPDEIERRKNIRDSIETVRQIEAERQIAAGDYTEEYQRPMANESADTLELIRKKEAMGDFGNLLIGENDFYILENNLIRLTVSKKGGRPYSVQLKGYQTHDSLPLLLFNGDSTIFSLQFPTRQARIVETNDLYFTLTSGEKENIVEQGDKSIVLTLEVGPEQFIEYTYTLAANSYMVDFRMNFRGMNEIIGNNINTLNLFWEIYMPQQERGKANENNYTSIFYKHYQDDVDNMSMRTKKDVQTEDISTSLKWVAFKDQFFSSVIIAGERFSDGRMISTRLPDEDKYLRNVRAEIGMPYNPSSPVVDMAFYFGPNHFKSLKKYGDDLRLFKLVSLGGPVTYFINRYIIIEIFNFLEKYMGNYGIIILLLTIIIKLLLLPLTYKSYISQAKMKVLKPQVDEINAKIPKEKAMERQKATMDLYRKVGINPLGGCLPMLLQMPILYAMFRFFPTSIELRQEGFLWATDLSTYDAIVQWKTPIFLIGNHISLFTVLMTITTVITMQMSQATAGSANQMPGMKTMMYIMPFTFFFFLNDFSSGLTYYYFLANVITFGQNILFKRLIDEEALLKKIHSKKGKPSKKSGFQARIEKMARERGYKTPKK